MRVLIQDCVINADCIRKAKQYGKALHVHYTDTSVEDDVFMFDTAEECKEVLLELSEI